MTNLIAAGHPPSMMFDEMTAETNRRFQNLVMGIWEILDDLEEYKKTLTNDKSPKPSQQFNPFLTIGKY
jgi:hypothetical protein